MEPLKKHQGFTLFEIITVVIIIGVLTGLAMPQYFLTMERFKAEEGRQTLISIYAAQKRYELDHDDGQFATDLSQLDSVFSATPNFTFSIPEGGVLLGQATRSILYTLNISQNAQVTCTDLVPYTYCSHFKF